MTDTSWRSEYDAGNAHNLEESTKGPLSSGSVLNSKGCSDNSTCGPSFCFLKPNA